VLDSDDDAARDDVTLPEVAVDLLGAVPVLSGAVDVVRALVEIGASPSDAGSATLSMNCFIKLATTHYWDSLTFNRVIRNFVAQGGCPDTPEGFSGSPYLLAPEFNDSLKHVYGAVGAGRDDNPGQLSAGCQFYIVANRQGLPKLDNHYTVYGKVIKGMDVVEAIVSVPTDSTNQPLVPITLHVDVITMTADQLRGYGYVVSHVKN